MTSNPKKELPPSEPEATGLRKGLTSYGDQGFSLFLRKAFIKGAGSKAKVPQT
jgi:dihydroxy-acid dehydratase